MSRGGPPRAPAVAAGSARGRRSPPRRKQPLQARVRDIGHVLSGPEFYAQLAIALLLFGHVVGFGLLSGQPPALGGEGGEGEAGAAGDGVQGGPALAPLLALFGIAMLGLMVVSLLLGAVRPVLFLFGLFWLKPWDPASSPLVSHSAIQWWSLSSQQAASVGGGALADMGLLVLGSLAIAALGRLGMESRAMRAQGLEAGEVRRVSLQAVGAVLAVVGAFLIALVGVAL